MTNEASPLTRKDFGWKLAAPVVGSAQAVSSPFLNFIRRFHSPSGWVVLASGFAVWIAMYIVAAQAVVVTAIVNPFLDKSPPSRGGQACLQCV